ncbi:hypothetical protein A1F97_11214, partial [Pyrenophora tritici-repentis]
TEAAAVDRAGEGAAETVGAGARHRRRQHWAGRQFLSPRRRLDCGHEAGGRGASGGHSLHF